MSGLFHRSLRRNHVVGPLFTGPLGCDYLLFRGPQRGNHQRSSKHDAGNCGEQITDHDDLQRVGVHQQFQDAHGGRNAADGQPCGALVESREQHL